MKFESDNGKDGKDRQEVAEDATSCAIQSRRTERIRNTSRKDRGVPDTDIWSTPR